MISDAIDGFFSFDLMNVLPLRYLCLHADCDAGYEEKDVKESRPFHFLLFFSLFGCKDTNY